MPKLYLVETMVTYRMRYVVEARSEEHALDEVTMNTSGIYNEDWREFSQCALPEQIFSSREITTEEYLNLFNKDNDYLVPWTDEQKLDYINKIDYKD